uniref:Aquaporin 1 n=1 Tax=Protopterus annectens TaxID=7888 RepID=D0FZC4_PROAN|nr:aquaporin 1 [Protopterus annectens]BAI48049.1 aquaporin 1 [Protopterus annectens]
MAREYQSKLFWRAVVAEFVAMTVFVFVSISSAVGFKMSSGSNPQQDNVKVSLAFGLAIATMAQSVGHISGAHLNPAVTLGLLVSSQLSLFRAAMYITSQMLGSVVSASILHGVIPGRNHTLGQNQLDENVTVGQGMIIEIFITFQLVLCVLATTDKRRKDLSGSAPLAIGLSVALGHLCAIDYTGCGMNPARSFGPAVFIGFENHWVYWIGPVIGGIAASFFYDFILFPRNYSISERLKAFTGGNVEEYDLDGEEATTRVEMKPK